MTTNFDASSSLATKTTPAPAIKSTNSNSITGNFQDVTKTDYLSHRHQQQNQQHQQLQIESSNHHSHAQSVPLHHYSGAAAGAAIAGSASGGVMAMPEGGSSMQQTKPTIATFKGNTNVNSYSSITNGNVNSGGDGNDSDCSNILNAKCATTNDYNGSEKSISIGSVVDGRSSRINSHNNINNNSILKESKENLLQNNFNDGDLSILDGGTDESSTRHAEVDDPGDGLGPLPPKWETAFTERGELYFIDHNTGTSHWLDPRLSKFQKKSLEDCTEDELPYGWEKIEDSLYGTYYIDHVNRRTQYENPVLEAKRRLAEQKQRQLRSSSPPPPPPAQNSEQQAMVNGGGKSNENIARNTDPTLMDGKLNSTYFPIKREMQPPPLPPPTLSHPHARGAPKLSLPYKFTKNPTEMRGERITTSLVKSARGLGITIVGGDEGVEGVDEEFLQIKSIVPNGPAWFDSQLQTGDVLVYVNETCVLGFTHNEMVNIFQSIMPGETVTLEVCRGYPLPFDPNDPNTEVVTTIAVNGINAETDKHSHPFMKSEIDGNYNFIESIKGFPLGGQVNKSNKFDILTFSIAKGAMGFGFTIADSAHGQRVKKILDRNCCTQLQEGDVLLEINAINVSHKSHLDVVQILKECSKTELTTVKIQRESNAAGLGAYGYSPALGQSHGLNSANIGKLYNKFTGNTLSYRSKTPTADLYSTQQKEILPIRPKTPLVDTRRPRIKTPDTELLDDADLKHKSPVDSKSTNSLHELSALNQDIPYLNPYPKMVSSLGDRLAETNLLADGRAQEGYASVPNATFPKLGSNYGNQDYVYGSASMPPILNALDHQVQDYVPIGGQHLSHTANPNASRLYSSFTPIYLTPSGVQSSYHHHHHHESCFCYECQDDPAKKFRQAQKQSPMMNYYGQQMPASSLLTPLDSPYHHHQLSPMLRHQTANPLQDAHIQNERMQKRVNEILHERRKVDFSPLETQVPAHNFMAYSQEHSPLVNISGQGSLQAASALVAPSRLGGSIGGGSTNGSVDTDVQYELTKITLDRQIMGFGFRIVGGTEEGSQVTVGHVVPGGAADNDHRITTGDEILSIDGNNVVNASHHKVVSLMGEAALRGQVTMVLRRRVHTPSAHLGLKLNQKLGSAMETGYPYDVIVKRNENEGFGFVIISSSNQYYGSTIGKLISGSPADRCGELKVGDRIIAVNQIDISSMSHGDVVNLIKESGLHVRLTIGCPKENTTGVVASTSLNASATTNNPLLNSSAQPSPDSHTKPACMALPIGAERTNGNFTLVSQPQATQLKL